jgi:gliding motility-associated-like protein
MRSTSQLLCGLVTTAHANGQDHPLDDAPVNAFELVVDLGPDTVICTGGGLLLDATTPGASYRWNDGSTGATLYADLPGTYWVNVSLGACAAIDTITIGGGGPPRPELPHSIPLCAGASYTLDASYPASTVLWMDGDTAARRTVTRPGLYTVTVTNACGSTTAAVGIREDRCPCVPFLPKAFTPNGDGINDRVGPVFICASGMVTWAIFDRWGSLVFESNDVHAQWDGTIGGQPVAEGVYVWRTLVRGTPDDDALYMGHVTVLR